MLTRVYLIDPAKLLSAGIAGKLQEEKEEKEEEEEEEACTRVAT